MQYSQQAPMHVGPKMVQNLETFVNAGPVSNDLSMADISQQTFAMNAHLRQSVGHAGDRLADPLRVESVHSKVALSASTAADEADVGFTMPNLGSAEDWMSHQPQHVQKHQVQASSVPVANPLAGCVDAAELERLMRQQAEKDTHMAQAAQVLQNIQSQIGPFQADFLQQTMQEIAKRCAAPEGLSGEWGAAAVSALANGAALPGSSGTVGMPAEQVGAWSNWGQPPSEATAAASNAGGGASFAQGDAASFDSSNRIEELNMYIRQQSQEYLEGQAEWSRQIAEVKSEYLRDLQKVRRDKDEVERQARQEIMRLNQRLREHGLKDEGTTLAEGANGGDSPNTNQIGSWAAGVSLDEYNQVHAKWQAAEERVRYMEDYIKEQSSKYLMGGDSKEKDDEIATLRQVVLAGGLELQQANEGLQALRMQYEKKIQLWEQGARRLLNVADQFLGQRTEQSGYELRHNENGHFASTATKVSLTLSKDKEGGNVDSLRRLLKDALTQSDGKEGRVHREKKASRKGKDEDPRPSSEDAASEEGKVDDRARTEDSLKEGGSSTPWSPNLSVSGNRAGLSDSNASSRDTSPGPTEQVMGRNGLCPSSAATLSFVSQLANEMRQLLSVSNQPGVPTSLPQAPLPQKPAPVEADRGKVQEILDSIGPARKGVATAVILVEKMLRSLELDLRNQCQEMLGQATVPKIVDLSDNEEAACASGAREEAKRHIPLAEEGQVMTLSSLRLAQCRTSSLLAEFVQLPQKLKVIFDITKRLSSEVNGLVPVSIVQQAEARASQARLVEQRQSFHVELLQKRIQNLSCTVAELGGTPDIEDEPKKDDKMSEADAAAAAQEIQQELQQGNSHESLSLADRARLRQLSRELSSQSERVKSLEKEVVDLHLARYTERAQCLALMGFQNLKDLPHNFVDKAWAPGKPEQSMLNGRIVA